MKFLSSWSGETDDLVVAKSFPKMELEGYLLLKCWLGSYYIIQFCTILRSSISHVVVRLWRFQSMDSHVMLLNQLQHLKWWQRNWLNKVMIKYKQGLKKVFMESIWNGRKSMWWNWDSRCSFCLMISNNLILKNFSLLLNWMND
jgi:hypothetical protein